MFMFLLSFKHDLVHGYLESYKDKVNTASWSVDQIMDMKAKVDAEFDSSTFNTNLEHIFEMSYVFSVCVYLVGWVLNTFMNWFVDKIMHVLPAEWTVTNLHPNAHHDEIDQFEDVIREGEENDMIPIEDPLAMYDVEEAKMTLYDMRMEKMQEFETMIKNKLTAVGDMGKKVLKKSYKLPDYDALAPFETFFKPNISKWVILGYSFIFTGLCCWNCTDLLLRMINGKNIPCLMEDPDTNVVVVSKFFGIFALCVFFILILAEMLSSILILIKLNDESKMVYVGTLFQYFAFGIYFYVFISWNFIKYTLDPANMLTPAWFFMLAMPFQMLLKCLVRTKQMEVRDYCIIGIIFSGLCIFVNFGGAGESKYR